MWLHYGKHLYEMRSIITCSLPTTVYAAADSVVHQVALLPSNNGLQHSEQYCTLGCSAPFLD